MKQVVTKDIHNTKLTKDRHNTKLCIRLLQHIDTIENVLLHYYILLPPFKLGKGSNAQIVSHGAKRS